MANLHAVDMMVTIDGDVAAAFFGVTLGAALTGEVLTNADFQRDEVAAFLLVFAAEIANDRPDLKRKIEKILDELGVHDHTGGDLADGLTGKPSAN